MSCDVWGQISVLADHIKNRFQETGEEMSAPTSHYSWHNSLYYSPSYRRAHLEIVDKRETHKIYIVHATIFPHFNDPSPIWGFDVVCGPNKITGAFHDFSSAGDPNHVMMQEFAKISSECTWNKTRDLPDWARAIFSPSIVAAGNVNTQEEITDLCNLAARTLDYYLANVGKTQESGADFHMAQNRYCHYQKQNPHVIRSMVSMGEDEAVMKRFVREILFPEFE